MQNRIKKTVASKREKVTVTRREVSGSGDVEVTYQSDGTTIINVMGDLRRAVLCAARKEGVSAQAIMSRIFTVQKIESAADAFRAIKVTA